MVSYSLELGKTERGNIKAVEKQLILTLNLLKLCEFIFYAIMLSIFTKNYKSAIIVKKPERGF